MKRKPARLELFLAMFACVLTVYTSTAPGSGTNGYTGREAYNECAELFSPELPLERTSSVDTFNIVRFDFESEDWQGWTRLDNTAQVDTFFRVDTLLLPPGDRGMWCGLAADPPPPCGDSWPGGAGYGNNWRQCLVSDHFPFMGKLNVTFTASFDSEPGCDVTRVQYDAGDSWIDCAVFDAGSGGGERSIVLHTGLTGTRLRFLFQSDAAVSDEDGLRDSGGGCAISAVRIEDSEGIIDEEDFESSPIGARDADGDGNGIHWHAAPGESFGLFSGFFAPLTDKDPCSDNLSSAILFFVDSPDQSPQYPGMFDTPQCSGGGADILCQDEMVISPVIDMTRYSTGNNNIQDASIPAPSLDGLGGAYLFYTVYRDLPLRNLVFYTWRIRNIDGGTGCPGPWLDRGLLRYGPDKDYLFARNEIGDLLTCDSIQVALGCIDMSQEWYRHRATSAVHTPAPWFDNVRIQRYEAAGPRWHYRGMDLFQDNFPQDPLDIEGFVRADAAIDINPAYDTAIRPGDSVVVRCTSPLGGGIAKYCGMPSVFMHVRCQYIGDPAHPKPPLTGEVLVGNYGRFVSIDGMWTVIQGDTARTAAGASPDRYAFDLNDSLFTRGYRIDYYFTASDKKAMNSRLPANAGSGVFFEWTCLPTLASDMLYVDDYDGRGSMKGIVQQYYDPAFQAALPTENQPDRYDINSPSAMVSNGLGSRAPLEHLTAAYDKIIWDCGDLAAGTITDGTSDSDKSDDAGLLLEWLANSTRNVGLWISGDNVAYDLTEHMRSGRSRFLLDWCGVRLAADSYFEETGGWPGGGIVTPLVKGVPGGIFHDGAYPDSFLAFGGCPIINRFDVLEAGAAGTETLLYPDFGGEQKIAGIQSVRYNHNGYKAGTVWLGFSFMYIRGAEVQFPLIPYAIVHTITEWFDNLSMEPVTGHETPLANRLHQNYPNPFNSLTTIRFALEHGGRTTLKIYDAAGQHVRTLVDDVLEAGGHEARWDGLSDGGSAAASGVYFYRISSGAYVETRKMVLLR